MEKATQITIILPVYGRSELLEVTLESVTRQRNKNWNLIVADDGSDEVTQSLIAKWISDHIDQNIEWIKREKNLGLFGNLNKAIEEARTDWVLILCSDDLLLPDAVDTLTGLMEDWPESGLILSTFRCINSNGTRRPEDHSMHHDKISLKTGLVEQEDFYRSLMRLGSVNGNITGMAIHKTLWARAGGFREEWRHAADWEWLIRAGGVGQILLNRKEIAAVRTHDLQLSNANRKSGHELMEVSEVVQKLKTLKAVREEKEMEWWAAGIMKHQLLNVLREVGHVSIEKTVCNLALIGKTTSISRTSIMLAKHCAKSVLARRIPSANHAEGTGDIKIQG